ncbi:hypothetical protein D3Z48_05980 [Clostridiaceae bacterium]|nr:hypothetical protein [Clostridiaceae bacterium]
MAQQTSALWKRLWRTRGTEKEYGFDVSGVWYGPDSEVRHTVDSGLYEGFGIGNASTAKLTLFLYAGSIPRGAEIRRYIRLKNGAEVSEWLPKGVFFTNRRAVEDGYWTVEAFDVMRKAERVWTPDDSMVFPMPMPAAVDIFLGLMGAQLDPRTAINPNYTIDYPANEYTIRDELRYIAAAHAGNWIVTGEGRLLLVPLVSIPPETNYLVTEYGDAILFGGDRILVG